MEAEVLEETAPQSSAMKLQGATCSLKTVSRSPGRTACLANQREPCCVQPVSFPCCLCVVSLLRSQSRGWLRASYVMRKSILHYLVHL